jgi:hypothetical protein
MSLHVCAGTVPETFGGFGSVHRCIHVSAEWNKENLVTVSAIKLRKILRGKK